MISSPKRLLLLAAGTVIGLLGMVGSAPASHQPIAQANVMNNSLVPVYVQCLTPNATRNAPLSSPACAPPAPTAAAARVGPTSIGTSQVTVIEDDPGVAGDQTNVVVTGKITDVTTTGGADYNPGGGVNDDLAVIALVRLTDAAHNCGVPCHATTQDLNFPVSVNCVPTANTTIGSTCSVNTTLNSAVPGVTTGGFASNVQIFRVRVLDVGPNGVLNTNLSGTGDDTLFEQQGVWVP